MIKPRLKWIEIINPSFMARGIQPILSLTTFTNMETSTETNDSAMSTEEIPETTNESAFESALGNAAQTSEAQNNEAQTSEAQTSEAQISEAQSSEAQSSEAQITEAPNGAEDENDDEESVVDMEGKVYNQTIKNNN